MTPEEVEELSSAGLGFFINVASSIFLFTLLGIYSLAYCISLYIYFKTEGSIGNAKKAMICVLLVNFILMLIYLVISVSETLEFVKYGSVVTLPGGIVEQIVAVKAKSQATVYKNVCAWSSNVTQLVIADTVIVWRAWAVWIDNTKVKWTLFLLMLADIAAWLADGIAIDIEGFLAVSDQLIQTISLDWVVILLSLSVNMIATCSIAFRAWFHHKSMNSISIRRKKTKGEQILLLLVESGAIYMLVQLFAVIISALNVNAPLASAIYFVRTLGAQLYLFAAILNPVAIFILLQTQNTYDQSFHLEEIPTLSLALSQQAQSQQVSS
ncbi:hypothetical protein BDP27DRAFT_1417133 [Rhodocollybia butyracea]|uniref:Uncharacterized protein n=1 Tax=Rhodocollybia butyracea TaxID=206335 RepID=A0A9P5UCZ2_9AGAR|nr:hypothetical protein BDP27DRAFT_1417133 [Rhodocollybia butyracea]